MALLETADNLQTSKSWFVVESQVQQITYIFERQSFPIGV